MSVLLWRFIGQAASVISRIVRFTATFLLLSLLLTACGRRDAKFARQIAGTWTNESSVTMTFTPDGNFSTLWLSPRRTNIFEGTWQIRDGIVIFTTTNASGTEPHAPVSDVGRAKIIHVDDHQLVYTSDEQTISLGR